MLTGISTACLYPLETEKALNLLANYNIEAIEVFPNCEYEISKPALLEMRKVADAHGTKILSLHPHTGPMEPITFFSGYSRRFNDGVELYKRYYEAANLLGAELVVFHGGARIPWISYEEYFDKFGLLVEHAVQNGSCLCHENVSRCIGYCSQFFKQLAVAVPKAEFVFDIKQAVRAEEDVFDFAKTMGNRIKHIHFSDNDEHNSCLLPGTGTFNTAEFLNVVTENGFNGGVIVELYRENFGEIVELISGYQRLFTDISTVRKNAETDDSIRQIT